MSPRKVQRLVLVLALRKLRSQVIEQARIAKMRGTKKKHPRPETKLTAATTLGTYVGYIGTISLHLSLAIVVRLNLYACYAALTISPPLFLTPINSRSACCQL